ncbi:MAG: HipA N-terminal domain-containing protein [Balneolaceae bacterium]|nr:HipA N-terminal domain-containing protein [Balneolaceae bacterium]
MRKAEVYIHGNKAGMLIEEEKNARYRFEYKKEYDGPPISVTMPVEQQVFSFDRFPPFFEGLLPEGVNLEVLLRSQKIDRGDAFAQLSAVGADTVGAVTVEEVTE